MLAFLYLPIAIMIAMAFNQSALYELPFNFSFAWFEALSGNTQLWTATRNSVLLATASTIIATILGTMAALSFARYQFRGKTLLRFILFVPVTVPWLIIATAMLVFFFWVGIGRGLHAMLLAHVALSLPYAIVIVGARLASFPMELEEAAATLGATPWQVFWRISAPIIAPGIVAAASVLLRDLLRPVRDILFPLGAGRIDPAGRDLFRDPKGIHAGDQCHFGDRHSSFHGDHADLLAALPLQRHPGGRVNFKPRWARSRG